MSWTLLHAVTGTRPDVVPVSSYFDAQLVVSAFLVRGLRVERNGVLHAEIVGNFLDSLCEIFIGPGKEGLRSGFPRKSIEDNTRIVDLAAVFQGQLCSTVPEELF